MFNDEIIILANVVEPNIVIEDSYAGNFHYFSSINTKVDKDLTDYTEVTRIEADTFTYIDNDGSPEKIGIVSGDIETDVVLWTGGKIKSELDLKQDVIIDNEIGNDLLAQMPTMTIKGNDTGATANAKDLTVVEVMELLSPSGLMEVPHNLKVYGNIEQVGGSYETHQEQVYTTKDHIILRDGAVGGLGTGSYAGLFAKLADGTNNAGLVFDGDGMARVGDIGTNLASPDFSQTQALATREDSPVSNAVACWNDTLKRFDTSSKFTFNGSTGSINELTVTNDAVGDTPLIVNAMVGTTANLQTWKIDNTNKVIINQYGDVISYSAFYSEYGLYNRFDVNRAYVNTSNNGTVISRNIADANPALKVNLVHASATGNIVEFQHAGNTAMKLSIFGEIYASALFNLNSASNSRVLVGNNGTLIQRNINDANPALIINEQQGTGNIANFQFGGVNKLEVTKDGWLFQNGVRLFHQTTNANNTYFGQLSGNTTAILGTSNTGFGSQSLTSLSTGNANTAIGALSLQNTTSGGFNVAVGYNTLTANTNGSYNIGIGYLGGRYIADGTTANTTSDYSIYLGTSTKAGADNNQNEIVIGYNAIGKGSNTAVIGNTSLTDIYLGGNGTANLYLGAIKNQAIGDIPATINAITGTTANLLSLQVNGVEKASIGASGRGTFTSLSTGSNTLLGTAGLNITTGTSNVLIGYLTATFLTEGIENVAIGSKALNNAYTNNYSVAIGNRALERLLAGDNTIGIGHNAGRYYGYNYPVNGGDLTTSSNSIYIGNEASAKENSISNEIVLGYNAIGNGSNTATIGNSSLTGLYLGSATAKLYGLVDYDNTTSGLTATDQQGAIDELAGLVDGVGELLGGI